MGARAIWKGVIEFGDVEAPVKLYSGIEDHTVHFRLLHDKDRAPVKQQMVDTSGGKEVAREQVRMGAPVGKHKFVLLTGDDLASIEPPESRSIEVGRFVPSHSLDHALYDRPYWLGPDSGGESTYAALVDALRQQKREGVARWVMRRRSYVGALRVEGEHLMLVTLRRAGEVISPNDIDPPKGREPEAQELNMARQLVEMLKGEFDPQEYHDRYRESVMELIDRKARGEKIKLEKPKKKSEAGNLAHALEQSLAALGPKAKPSRRQKVRAHG